jgi:hypothetical protein
MVFHIAGLDPLDTAAFVSFHKEWVALDTLAFAKEAVSAVVVAAAAFPEVVVVSSVSSLVVA